MYTDNFLQEKLLGLMSLPTKDRYEELKEKRKQELERKLQMVRAARGVSLAFSARGSTSATSLCLLI